MKNSILVVDDQQETVDLLYGLLLQQGYLPRPAYSGKEAMQAAGRELPDVVLSDLAMPGMSGFELAEHMKASYGERCPTMIALTGWTDSSIAAQALNAGFSFVLTKPVDFLQLIALMKLAMAKQEARRAPLQMKADLQASSQTDVPGLP